MLTLVFGWHSRLMEGYGSQGSRSVGHSHWSVSSRPDLSLLPAGSGAEAGSARFTQREAEGVTALWVALSAAGSGGVIRLLYRVAPPGGTLSFYFLLCRVIL